MREREAACLGEAERLRGEAERIAGCCGCASRSWPGCPRRVQVVGELPVVAHAVAVPGPAPRFLPRGRIRARRASGGGGLAFAERALGVLAGYAGPVRCRQVVEGLGLEATARNVERVRHQLKKTAAAGRVVQTPGGLFTLARAGTAAGG